MLYLRFFLFILAVLLCVSQLVIGWQRKLTSEEEKYISNEFDIHTRNISSLSIDQTKSEGTSERKTLIVWMKSLSSDARGLAINDSGKLIYRFDNYQGKHNQEFCLLDLLGEVVYTISRKRCLLAHPYWEGYTGSQYSNTASFRVKEYCNHGFCDKKSTMCVVNKKNDDSSYSIQPCRIVKSSNAKLEFELKNAERQTIAELKQMHGDGEVALERDVFRLDVEPEADVPFIVALVTVFGLINHLL